MSEIPSNLPPIPHENKLQASKSDSPTAPGSIDTSELQQPFPGMHMTNPQIKMFWNNMSKQMISAINAQTQQMKKALRKLKESESD